MSLSKLPAMVLAGLIFEIGRGVSSDYVLIAGFFFAAVVLGILTKDFFPKTKRDLFSSMGIATVIMLAGSVISAVVFLAGSQYFAGYVFDQSFPQIIGMACMGLSLFDWLTGK